MTEADAGEVSGRERSLALGAALVLAAGALVLEYVRPFGAAAGLLYLAAVLVAARRARPGELLLIAGLASLLALAGAWFQGAGTAEAFVGRGLAVAAIWAVTGGLMAARARERTLRAERSALRAQLREREARLAAAQVHAALASRNASDIIAGMSHELRTPLNAIIGFSDIVKNEMFGPVGSERYRDYMRDINRSGRHLLELVNDLLDMAKIETGAVALDETTFEIAGLLRACAAEVGEVARAGGLRFVVEAAEGLPALRADRNKVGRVLLDLLTNAIKFTPPGGSVRLSASAGPESGCVFEVADTGIGIALKDIPRALTPFGLIDNPLRDRHEGTGLGLPLAKALTELHAGTLDLRSEAGLGTTVTVRFPAERLAMIAKVA